MNKKEIAVIALSGGMDSATCLGTAIADGFEPAVLHLNYGQKTQRRETECYEKLCDFYKVKYRLPVDIGYLTQIGGSSLTDSSIDVPVVNNLEETTGEEIPNSYVPFRNANILAIAVSWAEVIGAAAIYIGATQVDFSGYPDCRGEFFDAFEKMANLGTKPETHIEIRTPLLNFTKADIVRRAAALGVPLELTWSCYKDDDEACGECESCLLRLKGFREAGMVDPIPYAQKSR